MQQVRTDMVRTVTQNDTMWPSLREIADAEPPTRPITSAGQHHAPMSAGMLRTSVKIDMQIDFLSAEVMTGAFSSTGSACEHANGVAHVGMTSGNAVQTTANSGAAPSLGVEVQAKEQQKTAQRA